MMQIIGLLITLRVVFSLPQPSQDSSSRELGSNINDKIHQMPHCTGDLDFDCGEGELRSRCISSLWICDYIYDCSSGADEINCKHLHKCPAGTFMCFNGDCLSPKKRCDGVDDCLDKSDERACSTIKSARSVDNANDRFPSRNEMQYNEMMQHQAEAIVDDQNVSNGPSMLLVFFSVTLIICLALLATLWTIRRYPDTASRVDHALKEFNRTVNPTRLIQRSSPSRVNIISPPNNENFFDNPMNTVQQQPLVLNVAAVSPSMNTSSPNQNPAQ